MMNIQKPLVEHHANVFEAYVSQKKEIGQRRFGKINQCESKILKEGDFTIKVSTPMGRNHEDSNLNLYPFLDSIPTSPHLSPNNQYPGVAWPGNLNTLHS